MRCFKELAQSVSVPLNPEFCPEFLRQEELRGEPSDLFHPPSFPQASHGRERLYEQFSATLRLVFPCCKNIPCKGRHRLPSSRTAAPASCRPHRRSDRQLAARGRGLDYPGAEHSPVAGVGLCKLR